MVLLHPTYFSPIIQYVAIVRNAKIIFEVEDNFQKQSYRNRCYIYTASGKQLLNVPVQRNKGVKEKTKDVKIDYKDNWHKLHLRTLKTAYSSSPFFEFYIDELLPVFEKQYTYLLDLNFLTHEIIMDAIQLEVPQLKTSTYLKKIDCDDFRYLVNVKVDVPINFDKYTQVFNQNHGFISNLSILDLLFMEGPNTLNYLESQT